MDSNAQDKVAPCELVTVDGTKSDSIATSPTSSVGGPSRAPKKQLPISRTPGTASGYERPERARTSHACEPCRERKTKCDGERPSCRRCLHTGTPCHYGYGKGWKKRKTAEDLTVTSRKLARYEELLTDIFPLVPENVRDMIVQARQQEFTLTNANDSADSSTPASSAALDGDFKSNSPPLNRVPLPPLPVAISQSASPLPGSTRGISRSLVPESSYSSSQPSSSLTGSSKSPTTDDSGSNSAFRLPSITRHGYLLEDDTRTPSQSVPPAPREPQYPNDQNDTMAVDGKPAIG